MVLLCWVELEPRVVHTGNPSTAELRQEEDMLETSLKYIVRTFSQTDRNIGLEGRGA